MQSSLCGWYQPKNLYEAVAFCCTEKRLFDKLAYDEIQWLLESLSDKGTAFQEFEFNIELIYHRSLEMIKEQELPGALCQLY
ncbi:hypothetical protein LRM35_21770 [Klebsiella variicola subsp. variicola]|nr:hypothetical protein LRM35_21770 [Klebsiella variicola subsp. variicola]